MLTAITDGGDRLRSGKERVASGILRSVQQSAFGQTKGWLPMFERRRHLIRHALGLPRGRPRAFSFLSAAATGRVTLRVRSVTLRREHSRLPLSLSTRAAGSPASPREEFSR